MGTRNKTHVIKDSKFIIKQYGQWDGYPTTSTATIVEQLQGEILPRFIEALDKVEYVGVDYCDKVFDNIPEYWFGAKRSNLYDEITNKIYELKKETDYQISLEEIIDTLMEKYDNQFVADYMTMTRDTGYMIMEAVASLAKYDIVIHIYLEDYLGFDIEAVNTIDLDNKLLAVNWHGKETAWSFDKLPTPEELEKFQAEDDGE